MSNPELNRFWQQALSDWQASGLSGAAYCKQQSLAYHRFVYWRQKLVSTADEKVGVPSGFARVTPVVDDSPGGGLTVSLPGGIAITGLHAGNVALLGALLKQL
jgi:hypothetical protein